MYFNWKLSLQLLTFFAILVVISASSNIRQNGIQSPIESQGSLVRDKRFTFSGLSFSMDHMFTKMSNIMSVFGIETTSMLNLQKIYNSTFSQSHLLFKRKILNLIMRTCNFILGFLPEEPVQPHSWFTKNYRLSYQTQKNQPGSDADLEDNLVGSESIGIDFVDSGRPAVVTQKVLNLANQPEENVVYLDLTSDSETNSKTKRQIRNVIGVKEILKEAIEEAEILRKVAEIDESQLENMSDRKKRSLHLNVNFAASRNYNNWHQSTTTTLPPIEIQKNLQFGLNWDVRREHRHHIGEYHADDYVDDDIFLRKRRDINFETTANSTTPSKLETTTGYSGTEVEIDLITDSYSDSTTVVSQKEDNTISIEEITSLKSSDVDNKHSEVSMKSNKEKLLAQMGKAYFPAEIILTHTTKPNQNQERSENTDSAELTDSGEVKEEDPAHQLLFLVDDDNSGSGEIPQEIIVDNHVMSQILDEVSKITEESTSQLVTTTTEIVDFTDLKQEENKATAEVSVGTTTEQTKTEDTEINTTTESNTELTTLFAEELVTEFKLDESEVIDKMTEFIELMKRLQNLEKHVGIKNSNDDNNVKMTTESEAIASTASETTEYIRNPVSAQDVKMEVETETDEVVTNGSEFNDLEMITRKTSESPSNTEFIVITENIAIDAESATIITKIDKDSIEEVTSEMEEKVDTTTELQIKNEISGGEIVAVTSQAAPNSETTTFVTKPETNSEVTISSILEMDDIDVEIATTLQSSATSENLKDVEQNSIATSKPGIESVTIITESSSSETEQEANIYATTLITELASTTTEITTVTPSPPKPILTTTTTTEGPISLVFPQGYTTEEVDELTKNLMHHHHLKHLAEGKHLDHIILKLAHDVGLNNLELITENIESRLENHDKKLMVLVRKKKMNYDKDSSEESDKDMQGLNEEGNDGQKVQNNNMIDRKLMDVKDNKDSIDSYFNDEEGTSRVSDERLIRQIEINEEMNLKKINNHSNQKNTDDASKEDSLPLPISLLQQQEIQEMQNATGTRSERKRLFVSNTTPASSSVPILTSSTPSTSPIPARNHNIVQIPRQSIIATTTNYDSTGEVGTAPSIMIQNMQKFMNKMMRRRKRPQMSMGIKMMDNMTKNSETIVDAMTEKINILKDQKIKHKEHVTEKVKPIDDHYDLHEINDEKTHKETEKPTTTEYHHHKVETSTTAPASTSSATSKSINKLMHSKAPMHAKTPVHHQNSDETKFKKKQDDDSEDDDDYDFTLDDIYDYFSSYGDDDDDSEEKSSSQKANMKLPHAHHPASTRKDGKRNKRHLTDRFRNTLDKFRMMTNCQHFQNAFSSFGPPRNGGNAGYQMYQHYRHHNIQNSAPYPPAQYKVGRKSCDDNEGWIEYNSAISNIQNSLYQNQAQQQIQKQTQNYFGNGDTISQNMNNVYQEFSILPMFNTPSEFNMKFIKASETYQSTPKLPTTIPTTTTLTPKLITKIRSQENTNHDLNPPKTGQPSIFKVVYEKEKHLNDLNIQEETKKQITNEIVQEIEFNLLPLYVKGHQFKLDIDREKQKKSQELHAEITKIVEETLQNNLWRLKNPPNFKPFVYQSYQGKQDNIQNMKQENKEKQQNYVVKEIYSYKNEEQGSYVYNGYLIPSSESVTENPNTKSPLSFILETTTTSNPTNLEDEDVRIIIRDEIAHRPPNSGSPKLEPQPLNRNQKITNILAKNLDEQLNKLKAPTEFSAVTQTQQNSESKPNDVKTVPFNSLETNQSNTKHQEITRVVEDNLSNKLQNLKKATEFQAKSVVDIDRLKKLQAYEEITKVIENQLQNQLQNLKKQIEFNSTFGENLAQKEITKVIEETLQNQIQNLTASANFHSETTPSSQTTHILTPNQEVTLATPNNPQDQLQNLKTTSDIHHTTPKASNFAANQEISNIIEINLQTHLQKLKPTLNFNPKQEPIAKLTPNREITLVVQNNLEGQLQNLKAMSNFQPVALSRLETQKIEVKTASEDTYEKQPFLSSIYDPKAVKTMLEQGKGPDGLFLSSVYVPPKMPIATSSTTTTTTTTSSIPSSIAEKTPNLIGTSDASSEKRLNDNKKTKPFEESIKFVVGGFGDAFLAQGGQKEKNNEPIESQPETPIDLLSRFGNNSDGQGESVPPLIHVSQSQHQTLTSELTPHQRFQPQIIHGSSRFTEDDTDVLIFSRFGNEDETYNKTFTEKPVTTSELTTTPAPSTTSIQTTFITSTSMVTEKFKQFRAFKPKNNIVVNYIYKELAKESHPTIEPTPNHSASGPRRGDIIESDEDIHEEVDNHVIKALTGNEKDQEEEKRRNVIIEEIKAQQLENLMNLQQNVQTRKLDSLESHTSSKKVDVVAKDDNKRKFPEHVKEVSGVIQHVDGEIKEELENIFGVAESDSDQTAILKVLNFSNFGDRLMS